MILRYLTLQTFYCELFLELEMLKCEYSSQICVSTRRASEKMKNVNLSSRVGFLFKIVSYNSILKQNEQICWFPANLLLRALKLKKKFIHLKLCLATAKHNFKYVTISRICLICDQTFVIVDV